MPRRIGLALLPVVAAGMVVAVILSALSGGAHQRGVRTRGRTVHAVQRRHQRLPRAARRVVHGAAARRMPIPILMYHVIANPPAAVPYPDLWVQPRVFAAEMAALRRRGYWAITLRDAWRAWTRGASLPRKPVVVSFDDGYLGDYTNARPVLRRLRWPGVLNLALKNVGPGNLKPREVRALIRAGWEVDSHTIHHVDLTATSDAQLRSELVDSRREIAKRFGVQPEFFCYPAGRFDARAEAAVEAAGYDAATTTNEGYASAAANRWELPRVRVQSTDTPGTLLARLRSEHPPG